MEGFLKRYDEVPIKEILLVDIEEDKENREATTCLGLMVTYMVYITLSFSPEFFLLEAFKLLIFNSL